MKTNEIKELFTNDKELEKLNEKLLIHKENNNLIAYLDLIVPLNFTFFKKYSDFMEKIQVIYNLLNTKDYDFNLIHEKITELLVKISCFYKNTPSTLLQEISENPFFSQEQNKKIIKINHGGGLRNIINFLLNKNDGYPLEGDSRTGLQVHHEGYPSYMKRAYYSYAIRACAISLDIPTVLEAEIDPFYLLSANNTYEGALLPSNVKYLKNIKIIPLIAMSEEELKKHGCVTPDSYFQIHSYICENTFDAQKFSKELSFSDYQSFLTWSININLTDDASDATFMAPKQTGHSKSKCLLM